MATKKGEPLGFDVNFIIEKETKGSLRYAEVNDEGAKVEIADGAKIGTLYIRKSAFSGGSQPKAISISVTF